MACPTKGRLARQSRGGAYDSERGRRFSYEEGKYQEHAVSIGGGTWDSDAGCGLRSTTSARAAGCGFDGRGRDEVEGDFFLGGEAGARRVAAAPVQSTAQGLGWAGDAVGRSGNFRADTRLPRIRGKRRQGAKGPASGGGRESFE